MEEKLTLLLIENDPSACKKIIGELAKHPDFALVGVTNNAVRAMQYVTDNHPDAVIINLRQDDGEAIAFLKKIRTSEIACTPFIMVAASADDETAQKVAREYGADYIINKTPEKCVPTEIIDFFEVTKPVIKARSPKNTEESSSDLMLRRKSRRISAELDKLGMSSKSIGYRYLIEAIGVIMEKPVQHVCSIIGKRHGKTENSVERAMQNAINRTWAGADKDELLAHYTAKIKSRKGVPTITEFIYFYAQKLNNEF